VLARRGAPSNLEFRRTGKPASRLAPVANRQSHRRPQPYKRCAALARRRSFAGSSVSKVTSRRLASGKCFGQGVSRGRRGSAQFGIFGDEANAELTGESKKARIVGADSVARGGCED